MAPTTDDWDKRDALERKAQKQRKEFFKIVEPILWLIVTIIVVSICLYLALISGMIG